MKPSIKFTKIWFDDDLVEFRISVSDGTSTFSNNVYVGHKDLEDHIAKLEVFKEHIYGGLHDLQFGGFGPEYANGAFHARFHFVVPGKLFISTTQESEYEEFGNKSVAPTAKLYLKTEPALYDRFLAELRAISTGSRDDAILEGI